VKQIRKVNRVPRFAPDRSHNPRMGMAKRVHRNATQKIEIFFSVESKTHTPRPWVKTMAGRLYVGSRYFSAVAIASANLPSFFAASRAKWTIPTDFS
jgi:hypothetical protein